MQHGRLYIDMYTYLLPDDYNCYVRYAGTCKCGSVPSVRGFHGPAKTWDNKTFYVDAWVTGAGRPGRKVAVKVALLPDEEARLHTEGGLS